jgi:hypothetical protein
MESLNQLKPNTNFKGWSPPAATNLCSAKLKAKNSNKSLEIYPFTGVFGIEKVGIAGIQGRTAIASITIVQPLKKLGLGTVVASFCSTLV